MPYTAIHLTTPLKVEKLYSMHYFEYAYDFAFAGEIHNFWEAVYVDSGEVKITAGTSHFILKQGQVFLHPPMEFHSIECYGGKPSNTVIFSFDCDCEELFNIADRVIDTRTVDRDLLSQIIKESADTFGSTLADMFAEKIELNNSESFGSQQIVKNCIELLLIGLVREHIGLHSALPHISDSRIEEICNYINEHITEPMNFQILCAHFGIGHTAMKKMFRDHLGCGTMEYYNKRRIFEAKKMLREKKYSVSEISDTLQFSSIHYFSNKFKNETGMAPKEYAKKLC